MSFWIEGITEEQELHDFLQSHLRLEITRSPSSQYGVYISLKVLSPIGKEWNEISGEWIEIPDPRDTQS